MKSPIFLAPLVFLCTVLLSCKKETIDLHDTGRPEPGDTTTQRSFRIIFENKTDMEAALSSATVLMTFENADAPGNTIRLSAPLVFDKQYGTPGMKLPKGSYKLKRLLITEGPVTRFAIPLAGSAKAASVAKPLVVPLTLDKDTAQEVRLEVLPVTPADTPESFGYPRGTFGDPQNGPETEMDKRIFIRALFKIGEVVYDSIPVQLIVKSWDAKDEMTYNIHYLAAGTQAVYLSAKAVKYHLSISKWGIRDEMTLTKADVQENTVYDMGGEKAAKKLKTVYEYRILNGVTVPLTKTDYEYLPDGQLKHRQILGKRADGSNYVVRRDVFGYTGTKIGLIRSYDENNTLVKTTTAQYDAEGRVTHMEERAGSVFTKATMHYFPLETRSGLRQHYRVDVQYTYEHGHYTGFYSKTTNGLSVITDKFTANGNLEEGIYSYDFSINPYAHLHIPDLALSQLPGHNLTFQWKTWTRAHPEEIPHTFGYKYDADGYPTELVTQYRTYDTRKDTYAVKTVFVY